MKTNTQIKIDHYLGNFIAIVINWLVRLLGFILRLDHSLHKNPKTIVVCKYKGMGGIVQTTPLLQTLRLNFPDTKIVFVSTKANIGILSKIPFIDRIITIDDKSVFQLIFTTIKTLFSLWKLRVSIYLDLEIYSNFSSLITTLSLARNRAGFYRQASHYRMGIYTHMMYYNLKAPISKIYLQFAHLLNCKKFNYDLFAFAIDESNSFYNQCHLTRGEYIIINPNTSDLRIERRWPKEKFIELIQKIIYAYPDYKIVLIGAKSEKAYIAEISCCFNNPKVINVSGLTLLDDLLYLVKHAGLLITNDTGPMHLAFSYKVKCLSLFGPCAPDLYGENENGFVVYNNVYCSPCVHEFDIPPCKGNNQCMQTITVEQVWDVMLGALNHETATPLIPHTISYIGKNQEVLGVAYRG